MKLTVDKKEFLKRVDGLLTKGKLERTAKECNQISIVAATASPTQLHLVGSNEGKTIFGRTNIPCQSDSDFKFTISDLAEFYDFVNDRKESVVTVEIVGNDVKIYDKDGFDTIPLNTSLVGLTKAVEWDETLVPGDIPLYKLDGQEYPYCKWFQFNADMAKFMAKCIKLHNEVIINTQDGNIKFSSGNIELHKATELTFEGQVFSKQLFAMTYLFPVLSSAIGVTNVLYYITSEGKFRVFIKDQYCEWQVLKKIIKPPTEE